MAVISGDELMHPDHELSLAIFTMVLGAVLGAVLPPFGDAFTGLAFRRRSRGLHSALTLLFAASGIWAIAEISSLLFTPSLTGTQDVPTATLIASIFALAALTFAVGVTHLPKKDEAVDPGLSQALRYLFVGNIIWVIGNMVATFAIALAPSRLLLVESLNYGFTAIALCIFALGARNAWRSTSSSPK
jgi:hypothetical protein